MKTHAKNVQEKIEDETVCKLCDKKFSSKYTCRRHMQQKSCSTRKEVNVCHGEVNVCPEEVNVCHGEVNVCPEEVNVCRELANVNALLKCENCYKTFTKSKYLLEHQDVCKATQHPLECPYCHVILACRSSKSKHVKICKCNNQLTSPSSTISNQTANTIQNANTINNNNNYTVNIHLNNLGSESLNHITPDMLTSFAKQINGSGVARLVEAIHFDPNVPENHNVRIDSIKGQTLLVYDNNQWYIKDMTAIVNFLIDNGCKMLHDHYASNDALKKEDREEHHGVIVQSLHHLNCKVASVYQPTKRQIIASMRNMKRLEN
jgi:hypothetical protein